MKHIARYFECVTMVYSFETQKRETGIIGYLEQCGHMQKPLLYLSIAPLRIHAGIWGNRS